MDAFYDEVANRQLSMNVEYKAGGLEYVSLVVPDSKEDIALKLVSSGFLLAERRREKRLAKLVSDYGKAQEKAKSARVSVCISGLVFLKLYICHF